MLSRLRPAKFPGGIATALFDWILPVLLLILWALLAQFPPREPVRAAFDLTQERLDDAAQFSGLYEPLTDEQGAYRWTSRSFLVQLRWMHHQVSSLIGELQMRAGRPDPQPVSLYANERLVVQVTPDEQLRRYRVLLPSATADPSLRLLVQTVPYFSPPSASPLGVKVSQVQFHGVAGDDWSPWAGVVLGLGLLWLLMRNRGLSRSGTLLIWAPVAAALLALARVGGAGPLPYGVMALLALMAVAVVVTVVQRLSTVIVLALVCVLVSFSGMVWPTWFSDDALISFHYAQNFVAGDGLVYNPGERVEGYTNFLYVMLAALVIGLGQDPVAWGYLSGTVLALALVILTTVLAARIAGQPAAAVAAVLTGTSQNLLLHSARGGGLETALYALLLLSAAAVYLWPEEEDRGALRPARLAGTALLLALATLTRPEGAALLALTAAHVGAVSLFGPHRVTDGRWVELMRRLAALLGPYLLLVVPFVLWRFTYYGDLLPNTFYAKTGGGLRAVMRGVEYAWGFALTMGGPLLLLAFVGLSGSVVRAMCSRYGYLLLLTAFFTSYVIAVGGDHFRGYRFFVPLVPLIALLMTDGLQRLVQRLPTVWLPRAGQVAALLVVLSGYSLYAAQTTRQIDPIIRGLDDGLNLWTEIGWWLHDETAETDSIAVMGAGAIAYYGQRETIDMLGLTDRHIARVEVAGMGSGPPGHEKSDPDYVLNERQPTYVPGFWIDYFPDSDAFRTVYRPQRITTRYGREVVLWVRLAE